MEVPPYELRPGAELGSELWTVYYENTNFEEDTERVSRRLHCIYLSGAGIVAMSSISMEKRAISI